MSKKPFPLLLAAAAAALSVSGCSKIEDAAFGQRVRTYLLAHPEVLEEVADKLREKKQSEALNDHKASEASIPKYRAQLERDPDDLVANPNGKITMVQFADYRCGFCKQSAPEILRIIQENPDVRVVFKEFPIFHGVSDTAAKIALTPQAKAKGVELYHALMTEPALDDAGIDRHLKEQGLDPAEVRKAAESPEIKAHLAETHKLAVALNIQGTPAFVIGDTLIPGADIAAINAAILQAKAGKLKTL